MSCDDPNYKFNMNSLRIQNISLSNLNYKCHVNFLRIYKFS